MFAFFASRALFVNLLTSVKEKDKLCLRTYSHNLVIPGYPKESCKIRRSISVVKAAIRESASADLLS